MIDDEVRGLLARIISLEYRVDKLDGGLSLSKGKVPIHIISETKMQDTGARTLIFMTEDGYNYIRKDHSFCPASDFVIGWVDDDDFLKYDEDKDKLDNIPIMTNKNHDNEEVIRKISAVARTGFDSVPLGKYYAFMYFQDILDALFGKNEGD